MLIATAIVIEGQLDACLAMDSDTQIPSSRSSLADRCFCFAIGGPRRKKTIQAEFPENGSMQTLSWRRML